MAGRRHTVPRHMVRFTPHGALSEPLTGLPLGPLEALSLLAKGDLVSFPSPCASSFSPSWEFAHFGSFDRRAKMGYNADPAVDGNGVLIWNQLNLTHFGCGYS